MPTTKEKSPQHPIDNLGHFECCILTAVITLGPERAYGLTIHEEVEHLSRRRIVSLGSIYTTLDRLEKKGFVSFRFADASAERGGRPRKYFKIEAAGQTALRHSLHQADAMATALRTAEGMAC